MRCINHTRATADLLGYRSLDLCASDPDIDPNLTE